ncbi:hypothetical protein [Rhodopseudomonas palustris]|uniref:hypothetical protein n=1 Tax=Rhodopseudomonas palustris TaxID=1076 RepID=UPI0021F256E0|nr:hypothetical protein [Rhodopseudomonas palustris]UYO47792.1 hypothetical protein KQX64_17690 [Rhodopseudomonas palustris]UYO52488.1 hypothetical protein KQX61_18090 [Rhodopseudomonas palustris]
MVEPTTYWFEIAKVFAGPVATVFAAAVAVFVTWRIGRQQLQLSRQQAEVARAQRDIAFDKLKHDLFEHRYAIYTAAETILKALIGVDRVCGITEIQVDANLRTLQEAVFFFPDETVAVFEEIKKRAIDLRFDTRNRDSEEVAATLRRLEEIYREFPAIMRPAMAFSQLTSS